MSRYLDKDFLFRFRFRGGREGGFGDRLGFGGGDRDRGGFGDRDRGGFGDRGGFDWERGRERGNMRDRSRDREKSRDGEKKDRDAPRGGRDRSL